MKVALVCIAKWEENYIDEWIRYHKLLNFDRIFIYDNGNDWKPTSLVHTDKDVTLIPWSDAIAKKMEARNHRQTGAYNNFIKTHQEYDWVLFIDCDEFLVLKKNKTIHEFIEQYNHGSQCIGIYTYLFGDNSHETVDGDNYSVLTRFTKRRERYIPGVTPHFFIKSLIKNSPDVTMLSAHTSQITPVDTSGNPVLDRRKKSSSYSEQGVNDVAQLNHYFGKTIQEYSRKIERGRATSHRRRTMGEFYHHNINEVEDYDALNFYLTGYGVDYEI